MASGPGFYSRNVDDFSLTGDSVHDTFVDAMVKSGDGSYDVPVFYTDFLAYISQDTSHTSFLTPPQYDYEDGLGLHHFYPLNGFLQDYTRPIFGSTLTGAFNRVDGVIKDVIGAYNNTVTPIVDQRKLGATLSQSGGLPIPTWNVGSTGLPTLTSASFGSGTLRFSHGPFPYAGGHVFQAYIVYGFAWRTIAGQTQYVYIYRNFYSTGGLSFSAWTAANPTLPRAQAGAGSDNVIILTPYEYAVDLSVQDRCYIRVKCTPDNQSQALTQQDIDTFGVLHTQRFFHGVLTLTSANTGLTQTVHLGSGGPDQTMQGGADPDSPEPPAEVAERAGIVSIYSVGSVAAPDAHNQDVVTVAFQPQYYGPFTNSAINSDGQHVIDFWRSQFYSGPPKPVTITFPCGPYGVITPPPPTTTGSLDEERALLVPVMDVDTLSGRLYLAIGGCTYRARYAQTIQPDGTASMVLSKYNRHRSSPIYLAVSQAGNALCPFLKGKDIGVTTPTVTPDSNGDFVGLVALPDSIVAAPQEGLVRVGYRVFDPASPTYIIANPAWRYSYDLGDVWHDADVAYLANTTPIGAPTVNYSFLQGSRRGRRSSLRPQAALPPIGRESQGGAPGWTFTQGLALALLRMPVWLNRSALGAFHRTFPEANGFGGSNPGAVSLFPITTQDDLLTQQVSSVLVVGGYDTTLTGVPGYPFPGDWAGVKADSQPIFGFPPDATGGVGLSASTASGGGVSPLSPAGGMCWARGWGEEARVTFFCPAIMRMPLVRTVYTPSADNLIDEGFKQDTDSEGSGTGIEWGRQTCICYSVTCDGGRSFGDLGCVKVGGEPLLAHTDTVRIAAACGPGDELFLCVCDQGVARLYRAQDGGFSGDFTLIGESYDAGLNWADPQVN